MPSSWFGPLCRWSSLLVPLVTACTPTAEPDSLFHPARPTLAGHWQRDSTRLLLYDAPQHVAASSFDSAGGRPVNWDTTAWLSQRGDAFEAFPLSLHGDTLRVAYPGVREPGGKPLVRRYVITSLNEHRLVLRETQTDATVNGPLVWVWDSYYSQ